MREVVDSVARVNDIMSEITSASQEQRIGIDQVNEAIAQMDQVTQQNAALVEEAAAAAASLQEQADALARRGRRVQAGRTTRRRAASGLRPLPSRACASLNQR